VDCRESVPQVWAIRFEAIKRCLLEKAARWRLSKPLAAARYKTTSIVAQYLSLSTHLTGSPLSSIASARSKQSFDLSL
jgi:hypothetical protein